MAPDVRITFGEKPEAEDLLTGRILGDPHTYVRDWIDPPGLPLPSIHEEEATVRSTKPLEVADGTGATSVTVLEDRVRFIPMLRAITRRVWELFQLPTSGGLDIGSGPEGIMVRRLLPDFVDRESWLQLECSPDSCRTNRALQPELRILEGSYHDLAASFPGGFDLVTGLSTLDATVHQAHAIRQIAVTTREYFLHVQDMQPTPLLAPLTLSEMGYRPPFLAKTLGGRAVVFLPEERKFEPTYRMELFRCRIGRIIAETPGLELLCNQYVTATREMPQEQQSHYYVQGMVFSRKPRPGEMPVLQASAIVTLARKNGENPGDTPGTDGNSGNPVATSVPLPAVDSRRGQDCSLYSQDGDVRVTIAGIPRSLLTTEDSQAHSSLASTHVSGRYFQLRSDGTIVTEREPKERLFSSEATRPARDGEMTPQVIVSLEAECRRRFPEARIIRCRPTAGA